MTREAFAMEAEYNAEALRLVREALETGEMPEVGLPGPVMPLGDETARIAMREERRLHKRQKALQRSGIIPEI